MSPLQGLKVVADPQFPSPHMASAPAQHGAWVPKASVPKDGKWKLPAS